MAKSVADDQKAKTARSRSNQAGKAKGVSGQNVVGEINAQDSARVSIKQVVYTQLSESEEERKRQETELETLQKAILQKVVDLNHLINTEIPSVGNPYLFLQPFGFTDQTRFFGRDDILSELIGQLISHPCTFLCGNPRVGKTSLLKSGLVPALISQGHLPLFISVTGEALAASLKKCLLPNLDSFHFLKAVALTEFLHIASDALPPGKKLCVLIDDFEGFFQHTQMEQDNFRNEWLRYLNSVLPQVHWLFCIPSDKHHLLNFFKPEIHPNANTVSLPPLSCEAAREALVKPAEMRGIHIHADVIVAILDALGGNHIDPANLQLVGYMLAGAKGTLIKEWDLTYYTERGQAEGILRDYLELAIAELEPPEREPAWEILTVLADAPHQAFTRDKSLKK